MTRPDAPPASLVVFEHPIGLPLERDIAEDPRGRPSPEAAVTWANVLPQALLRDTTVIAVNRVRRISRYPEEVPPDVEPWRANARYERVYLPSE